MRWCESLQWNETYVFIVSPCVIWGTENSRHQRSEANINILIAFWCFLMEIDVAPFLWHLDADSLCAFCGLCPPYQSLAGRRDAKVESKEQPPYDFLCHLCRAGIWWNLVSLCMIQTGRMFCCQCLGWNNWILWLLALVQTFQSCCARVHFATFWSRIVT